MSKRDIKSMQLYPRPERILDDLRALGFGDGPLPPAELSRLDQLHYHGTDALDIAIATCGIRPGQKVLEIGSGWGGCARYIAHRTGAQVTAVELQEDYDRIARDLTLRAGLADRVSHVNGDFLDIDLAQGAFDHVVSWLALFHIPDRPCYLSRIARALQPGGAFFAEDLTLRAPFPEDEAEDIRRHLFPNSLIAPAHYRRTLQEAGFAIRDLTDMTADWTGFTAERLAAFRRGRAAYEAIHGGPGYEVIHGFYDRMAGYFARGLVGGVRVSATLAE